MPLERACNSRLGPSLGFGHFVPIESESPKGLLLRELHDVFRDGPLGRVRNLKLRLYRSQDLAGLRSDSVRTVRRQQVLPKINQRFPQRILQRTGFKRGDYRDCGWAFRLTRDRALAVCCAFGFGDGSHGFSSSV